MAHGRLFPGEQRAASPRSETAGAVGREAYGRKPGEARMAVYYGNLFASSYVGTNQDDYIDMKGGDDIAYGQGGNDSILGGSGDDSVHGGDDDDAVGGQD